MIASDLDSALTLGGSGYFRLILLVGEAGSGKTRRLRELSVAKGYPMVSLGRPVAGALLELSERQRTVRVAELVSEQIAQTGTGSPIVLLDDIEVLFAPSLALNPLKLLQGLARNRSIVAAWPGEYGDDALTYAGTLHPEYRLYRRPDAVIVLARSGLYEPQSGDPEALPRESL